MSTIREDLEGAVHVDGHVLFAGDEIPEGTTVGDHLLNEADIEAAGDEIPEKRKPGRPRKVVDGE